MAYSLTRARNYRKSGRGVRKTLDKLRDPEIAFPIHFLSLKIDAKQKRRMWPVKTSGVWRASAIILALVPSAYATDHHWRKSRDIRFFPKALLLCLSATELDFRLIKLTRESISGVPDSINLQCTVAQWRK